MRLDWGVLTRSAVGTVVRCGVGELTVEWLKWPSEPYRNTPMRRLGEDEFGAWLSAPRGVAASYASTGPAPLPVNFLTVVPHGPAWWVATWMWGNPAVDIDVYVDIVHPPVWESASCLRVVDLDLDVIRDRGGKVHLDDEDEFVQNSALRLYPDEVVAAARVTAERMCRAVARRDPPFGTEPLRWLAVARSTAPATTWPSQAERPHRG